MEACERWGAGWGRRTPQPANVRYQTRQVRLTVHSSTVHRTAQPAVGRRVLPPVAHFLDPETNRRRVAHRGEARAPTRTGPRLCVSAVTGHAVCCLAGPLLASKLRATSNAVHVRTDGSSGAQQGSISSVFFHMVKGCCGLRNVAPVPLAWCKGSPMSTGHFLLVSDVVEFVDLFNMTSSPPSPPRLGRGLDRLFPQLKY